MTEKPIRILVADDRDVTVAGLRAVLATANDMVLNGEAKTAPMAVTETLRLKPDILIIDLKFQENEEAGINAIREILEHLPRQKIVAFTNWPHLIPRAEKAGAMIGVSKDISASDLLDLIRSIHSTDPPIRREPTNTLPKLSTGPEDDVILSHREQEVLQHLASGKTATQIGRDLDISPYTVRSHINSILTKLNAVNSTEAVHLAHQRGLLSPSNNDD